VKVFGRITIVALILLAVFTMANWSVFTAPATLDFLFFSVQGLLGLVLLAVTLAFVALFTIYALSLRTTHRAATPHERAGRPATAIDIPRMREKNSSATVLMEAPVSAIASDFRLSYWALP